MKKNNYIYIILFIVFTVVVFFPSIVFASEVICSYDFAGLKLHYEYGKPLDVIIEDTRYSMSNDLNNENIVDVNTGSISCPDLFIEYRTKDKGRYIGSIKLHPENGIEKKYEGELEYIIEDDYEKNSHLSHQKWCVMNAGTEKEYQMAWIDGIKINYIGSWFNSSNIQKTIKTDKLTAKDFENNNCPVIYDQFSIHQGYKIFVLSTDKILTENDKPSEFDNVIDADTGEKIIPSNNNPNNHDSLIDYDNPCSGDILKAMKVLSKILVLLKILAPLLIIIFGMVDFGKAVISSEEKAISKSAQSLIKRFVAGIIIFIIPTLVSALMDVIHLSEEVSSFEACTKCLLKTSECDKGN